MKEEKKKSAYAWIWDFAGEHRPVYVLSVLAAIAGVACGFFPYFLTAKIISDLLSGCREMSVYLKSLGIIAILWVARYLFHAISTTMSHKATFTVLGNIRKRCCAKLARVPLGYMLDTPSGSIKNILVERIDSIETTMAHIIPEFTSNILVPVGLLIYLFVLDWRMALAVLITVPLGFGAFCGMMIGYDKSYQNAVNKTKMENIRLGNLDATDEDVIAAAKSCGCHDFIMGLENGYQTIVGGAGGHLSGGERQRISIARAMLKNAPIIILDEATAFTDPENEAIIQSSVAKLVQGKTLIVIYIARFSFGNPREKPL